MTTGGFTAWSALGRAVGSLRLGDHVCCWYREDEVRTRAVAAYVAAGLRHGDRTVYFTDTVPVADVLAGLRRFGVPATAWESGQVRVVTAAETYLAGGGFDPVATIEGWAGETARARADGYRGLRAIGDMAWAARPVPGVDRLPWYEAAVNRVFAEGHSGAMCLYDERTLGPERRRALTAAHPANVEAAEHWAPALRLSRGPGRMTLAGEVDVANRDAVAALLEHVCAETDGPVTVDVTGLRFVDAVTARLLAGAAAGRPGGVRVVGASPLLTRLIEAGTAG
jgi:anti-anti-sigma regulatory factor